MNIRISICKHFSREFSLKKSCQVIGCIRVRWTVALIVIVVSWSHLITNKRHLLLTNSHQGFLLKYTATEEEKKQNGNSAYQHLRMMLLRTSPTLNVSAL